MPHLLRRARRWRAHHMDRGDAYRLDLHELLRFRTIIKFAAPGLLLAPRIAVDRLRRCAVEPYLRVKRYDRRGPLPAHSTIRL